MKRLSITKGIITLVLTLVCGFAANAISPRNYLYDTKEENGLVTSKTVFVRNDDGFLNKQVKYEFMYNEAGKVSVKKAYRWDNKIDNWAPFYQTSYKYNEGKQTIESNYGVWNAQTKKFDLNVQSINLPMSNYNQIFS